jgi:hypothetical protein
MRANIMAVSGLAILLASAWVLPVVAQEENKAEKAEKKSEEPAKAKAEKVSGDIGLLDTEKNYNSKTKAQEIKETKVKMGDVGLGSSAVVEYTTKGDKNVLTKMEFTPAKGE